MFDYVFVFVFVFVGVISLSSFAVVVSHSCKLNAIFLCCCCCRTFELRRELPCFTRMTLYSLTVTLALFYALFAVERGCTVLVCVGGGWRCSIHSIAIDLHVCKRGESLALFSASLVVVVDVSHSSFL